MIFHYERPQFIQDYILTKEAIENFEDMKSRKLYNVDELIGIYIARSKKQYLGLMSTRAIQKQFVCLSVGKALINKWFGRIWRNQNY